MGAVYRVADWADLNLSYERGNTLMFGFTLRTNFNDLRPALRDNPKPARNRHRQARRWTIPRRQTSSPRLSTTQASMRRRSFSTAIPYT